MKAQQGKRGIELEVSPFAVGFATLSVPAGGAEHHFPLIGLSRRRPDIVEDGGFGPDP